MALRLPHCARTSMASATLAPFLYPPSSLRCLRGALTRPRPRPRRRRLLSTSAPPPAPEDPDESLLSVQHPQHPHSVYSSTPFTDLRLLTITAGSGGNGCASFLREKFVPNGPANGGDGGSGGSVYIQAVYGETSLHKLARDGAVQATAGRNGQGSAINGKRGEDVVLRVPVGTVVREVSRWDPQAEELGVDDNAHDVQGEAEESGVPRKHGEGHYWLHYPRSLAQNLQSTHFTQAAFPFHHHRSSSEVLAQTHPTPVYLDLSVPTITPILLLPGAPGGFGNPHFVSTELRRPKFATKGGKGARMKLQLELKILADIGLVGLPNAGKSSFLRSVSRKQARVGEWAFTTLSPNIGTIVIDERSMAPESTRGGGGEKAHPRFTIADIPGLIADAHLNKGLGHGFLRHVERAKVLGFVLDLGRDDPVGDLEALWREVRAYERGGGEEDAGGAGAGQGMMAEMAGNAYGGDDGVTLGEQQVGEKEQQQEEEQQEEQGVESASSLLEATPQDPEEELILFPGTPAFVPRREPPTRAESSTTSSLPPLHPRQARPKMSTKPWFVIANKADLPGTESKYWALKQHLEGRRAGGREVGVLPISALKGMGVEKVVGWMKGMLGF